MNLNCSRWLALAGVLVVGSAAAEGFGLGLKAGTLGYGIEGTYALSDRFNLRFGANTYDSSIDQEIDGVNYELTPDYTTGALMLDWHPFKGVFRLTAGYIYNKNALRLTATPTEPQEIGGQLYDEDEIGTLTGDLTYEDKHVPYAGIGWGKSPRGRGLGFSLELGVMFTGKPDVTLTGDGILAGDPGFRDDLRQEEQNIEDEIDIYPVISFGLSYHF